MERIYIPPREVAPGVHVDSTRGVRFEMSCRGAISGDEWVWLLGRASVWLRPKWMRFLLVRGIFGLSTLNQVRR